MKFTVIDTKTGEYPDLWEIALKEDWAKSLCYCDMEGFAIEEDGTLILLDECGKHEYPPDDNRFKIVPVIETNADSIRAMSDEELARFMWNRDIDIVEKACKATGFTYTVDMEKCFENVLNWLKQESEP